jgi:hypothetical protein
MTEQSAPYIESYGYTWLQHPDGLYYGRLWSSEEAQLVLLESHGTLGQASVYQGEYRYFLQFPEVEEEETP